MDETAEHLREPKRAVFLPYAIHDYEASAARARERFAQIDLIPRGLHTFADPVAAVSNADAIIVGGGNTFRLVQALHTLGLIDAIRRAVGEGVPYWGASAGSNIACPTIRTTNDMPIIEPSSLNSLGLVPFQINPHFVDAPPPELQVGETRQVRLDEFLEENDVSVVGLREESWLVINGHKALLRGTAGAVLLQRREALRELAPGQDVSFLLDERPRYDVPVQERAAPIRDTE
jgi:dipeptidase E